MKHAPPLDVLLTLRANLRHFEESPDFGDSLAVEQIRKHLMLRIREAESTLRCRNLLEPASGKAAA